MSHLNIVFDRFASLGTVIHYILVISVRHRLLIIISFGSTFSRVFYIIVISINFSNLHWFIF